MDSLAPHTRCTLPAAVALTSEAASSCNEPCHRERCISSRNTTRFYAACYAVRGEGILSSSPFSEDRTSSYALFCKERRVHGRRHIQLRFRTHGTTGRESSGTSRRFVESKSQRWYRSESSEKKGNADGANGEDACTYISKTKKKGFFIENKVLNQINANYSARCNCVSDAESAVSDGQDADRVQDHG